MDGDARLEQQRNPDVENYRGGELFFAENAGRRNSSDVEFLEYGQMNHRPLDVSFVHSFIRQNARSGRARLFSQTTASTPMTHTKSRACVMHEQH